MTKSFISKQGMVIYCGLLLCSAANIVSADVITSLRNPINCSTYHLITSNTWPESQQEAIQLGGNLVTINDADENQWVFDHFAFFGGVRRDLWLGLNDVDSEGNMVWVSGEPVTFVDWQPGNPSDSGPPGQDYVSMFAGPVGAHISGWSPGKWDDFTSPDNLRSDYALDGGGTRQVYGVVEVTPGQEVFSGLYFDANNPGHGFDFNVLESGLIVYYYGHTSTGERLWLISNLMTAPIELGVSFGLQMFEIVPGSFGFPGDSETLWGSITVNMNSHDSGEATLAGLDGAVEMDLDRLAGLSGLSCPQ